MTAVDDPSERARPGRRPRDGAPPPDGQPGQLAAAALRIAESLYLPEVLERVAQQVAALLGGRCQVNFCPAHRPADARRSVAGLARPEREPGAALLIVPLVARGRRLGDIEATVPAPPGADLAAAHGLLRGLAAHAALAIDTADQVARLAPGAGAAAGPRAADATAILALVAHDLRGPLATLSSSVQLLVRKVRGAPSLDHAALTRLLELADAGVAQLEAQVEALAAPRAGGPQADDGAATPVELVALARASAGFYQQTTGAHQIAVAAAVPALAGPWARPHLERVLGNLIANAIKYSPDGGEIRITVGREDDGQGAWAAIDVQSRGIGIPADDLARLAQPGFRARNVGHIPGTGFGLASVREIVAQYGGTLAIHSAAGGGTAVLVRLPLAGAAGRDPAPGEPARGADSEA